MIYFNPSDVYPLHLGGNGTGDRLAESSPGVRAGVGGEGDDAPVNDPTLRRWMEKY